MRNIFALLALLASVAASAQAPPPVYYTKRATVYPEWGSTVAGKFTRPYTDAPNYLDCASAKPPAYGKDPCILGFTFRIKVGSGSWQTIGVPGFGTGFTPEHLGPTVSSVKLAIPCGTTEVAINAVVLQSDGQQVPGFVVYGTYDRIC